MSDGVLDLVVFILCLAILIPIGLGSIIPIAKEYNISQNVDIGDKSVPEVVGTSNKTDYDAKLDIYETVLTTQIQDYSMPRPRKLSVPNPNCPNEKNHFRTSAEAVNIGGGGCYDVASGGTPSCQDTLVIDITSTYKPDVLSYGNLVYTALNNTYKFDKYEIELSYGRHDLEGDESYRIVKR